jgi:predicted O-linked N-acetylglucosamine transferase (SPINDLY family)
MGVPVVSLDGNSHAGRMVASVLKILGFDELVAPDKRSYRRIVGELCDHRARLLTYRRELRSRFNASALRDEIGFTRAFEQELEQILR